MRCRCSISRATAKRRGALTGQHTGLTDLPLTERGERQAQHLGTSSRGTLRRQGIYEPAPARSPNLRACRVRRPWPKCDPDLVEWNYGEYEGRRSQDIRRNRPDWRIFRDGCPGGETLAEIGARADRVIARARAIEGNVLLFSSGHILRVLTARWLGLEPAAGRLFLLSTASLSALGYEHDRSEPVIRLWDDTRHLGV